MTVYRGGGFSYRGTVSDISGASDSPDITFSLVSEPDMRLTLRFPLFVGLPGRLKSRRETRLETRLEPRRGISHTLRFAYVY